MASDFWEAYRDPKWQKKRLEVMNAAEFKCQQCGTDERTLNVHHRHYRKGAKPWEYDNDDLACLCESCHETFHTTCAELRVIAGKLAPFMLVEVLAYARGQLLQQRDLEVENDDTSFPISPDDERGMTDAYGLFRGHDAAWLTFHMYNSNRPFVVTNRLMEQMVDYQRSKFQVVERTPEAEEIDQLLVACSG